MRFVIAGIFMLMCAAALALAYWGPTHEYVVECQGAHPVHCLLEREDVAGRRQWSVSEVANAQAHVRFQPRRRSTDRVFLYLTFGQREVFAAEFEGQGAKGAARNAAQKLNQVFSGKLPSARIEARPPSYMGWLTWGGILLLGMMTLAIIHSLFAPSKPKRFLNA